MMRIIVRLTIVAVMIAAFQLDAHAGPIINMDDPNMARTGGEETLNVATDVNGGAGTQPSFVAGPPCNCGVGSPDDLTGPGKQLKMADVPGRSGKSE